MADTTQNTGEEQTRPNAHKKWLRASPVSEPVTDRVLN